MAKARILIILFLTCASFLACNRTKTNAGQQAKIDDQLIANFIKANKIKAVKHTSGLYYQIIAPGQGNAKINSSSKVTVNYEGRLLSGSVFDKSATPISLPLNGVIEGWQIGVPLTNPGGKIRLFIPSALAYGDSAAGGLPPNAVLDFTIDLLNVQ